MHHLSIYLTIYLYISYYQLGRRGKAWIPSTVITCYGYASPLMNISTKTNIEVVMIVEVTMIN